MITILIVDDLDEKVIAISKIIGKFEIPTTVLVASDLMNARRNLNENAVDIAVLDLYLPVRFGDNIDENGGLVLLKEIQRAKFSSIPKIIFGLSVANDFRYDGFWPFFKYDSSNTWITPFKTAFNHVKIYQKKYEADAGYFGFQVYLEGKTDYAIFERCRSLFFEDRKDIVFRFENGAGAAWVTRQLLAHCMMLPYDKRDNSPVKCAGVYDNDPAGKNALNRINGFLSLEAAERRHFRSFVIKKHYSPIAKCLLPDESSCEMEDLYCASLWLWAYENNLLTLRAEPRMLVKFEITEILNDLRYLEDISEEQCTTFLKIYSEYEFIDESKTTMVSHWLKSDESQLQRSMLPIKFLLNDIINYCDE
ncbi:response regulator [Terrimonas ferruginea]|uniref:response regulator n=1 Tax=Terrimonas ferruginea TaxID=249 RepID=UPI00042A5EDD|nr:response regulator [Terrimonas ferruginea]